MYSIFKQTFPATAVEHSIYCRFYGGREKNLVLAGANQLRIFRLITVAESKPGRKDFAENQPPMTKLECLATYNLYGSVVSMAAASLAGSQRDVLLLSFSHAKLSLVEYDPQADNLKTLSLHTFEDEGIGRDHKPPEIRVDPEGRCAIMLVFRNTLAVLPFRKDSAQETNVTLSSYVIKLTQLEERVDNVVDVQFLHGYYEPTLIILYEPVGTFAGRTAVRLDTCCMVAVSLNTQQRVHPIIWSLTGLPFDCAKLLPVPKPLGGALILATNSVIYVNQSVPPFGVAVNSIADHSTNFPLKTLEGSRVALDCAQAAFLQYDRVVLSLKGGELYVLTLFADSMRSVRQFHLEKAAASILTTCLCICDRYLFLGSRLGNSLLLAFHSKEGQAMSDLLKAKKPRLESFVSLFDQDLDHLDDEEIDQYLYGDDHESCENKAVTYQFEVCDSLLNIGPCGQMALGEPSSTSTELGGQRADPDVEIVTTAGYGKNGALCVLQRSIKPQVVTTFDELHGVTDMFTVLAESPASEGASAPPADAQFHAYLLLSRSDATMVLQTGTEINELDQSGFNVASPTILAANVGHDRFIVQVCPTSVRLLNAEATAVHQLDLDADFVVASASALDPHVALLSADGRVRCLTFQDAAASSNGPRLRFSRSQLPDSMPVACLCLYRDTGGVLTSNVPDAELELLHARRTVHVHNIKKEMDDEDEYLYGDAETVGAASPDDADATGRPPHRRHVKVDPPVTHWLALVRRGGSLHLHQLDHDHYLQERFSAVDLHLGQRLLTHRKAPSPTSPTTTTTTTSSSAGGGAATVDIVEVGLFGLGHLGRRPVMALRTSECQVLLYEAVAYYDEHTVNETSGEPSHLQMRLRKLHHTMLLKEKRVFGRKATQAPAEALLWKGNRLKYFANIAGYSGVFISGPYPHWILLTSRGELRTHPMSIDGSVICFATFHNVNCAHGFLYVNRQEELRICQLPTLFNYDAPWPARKVLLRCTPHFLIYHVETKTYILATSLAETTNRIYRFNGDDKELSLEERDDRFPYPNVEKFAIQLISPVTWEAIPNTRMDLDDWEHVTCLKTVSLEYEGHASGLKDYLAVSTNYNYGEDIISRGRIFILDLIEVVPEPGQPLTKNKIKTLYAKDQKGAVTAISSVCGYLVAAIGQKIYLWQLKDDDLVGIAFIDTEIYIHQLLNIKSFILAADVYKSVSVLRFQEEYRTLCIVARDYSPLEVLSVEYYIDNTQLGFLVTDAERNLMLYMYQPDAHDSHGGHRLIRKADFHVGQRVSTMFRIRCKVTDPTSDRRFPPLIEKRHMVVLATLDGGVAHLLPIAEKTYRRLQMLHNVLHTTLAHVAGLNPKAFRAAKSHNRQLVNGARAVVDGDLVFAFLGLSHQEQVEVARKIGTRVDEIIDDLTEIDRYTAHF